MKPSNHYNITKTDIFTQSIWQFDMPNHKQWKKKLEDIALVELNTDKHNFSNQRKTPCNVKAKRTDWRSHHIYPAIGEVAKIIRDDMLPAVIKSENWDMPDELFVCHSWLNIYEKDTYAIPHVHGTIFSCVYFVKVPDNTGNLFLHDRYASKIKIKGNWEQNDVQINAKEGSVVVFNGDVMHSVTPNTSDDLRISLALNLEPRYTTKEIHKDMSYKGKPLDVLDQKFIGKFGI